MPIEIRLDYRVTNVWTKLICSMSGLIHKYDFPKLIKVLKGSNCYLQSPDLTCKTNVKIVHFKGQYNVKVRRKDNPGFVEFDFLLSFYCLEISCVLELDSVYHWDSLCLQDSICRIEHCTFCSQNAIFVA